MISASIAFACVAPYPMPPAQEQMRDMAVHLDYAFLPGQREVVLGPLKQRSTVMQVTWTKEFVPAKPSSEFLGNGWIDQAVGSVEWKVSEDKLFNKPCMVVKMSGWTKQIFIFKKPKKHELDYMVKSASTYWITDGKIVRQYEMRNDQFDGYRRINSHNNL